MSSFVVSAPGKLILMGEHAAVYGHPALVVAVNRRLHAEATLLQEERVELDLPAFDRQLTTTWSRVFELTRRYRDQWWRSFGQVPHSEDAYITPSAEELVQVAVGETLRALGADAPPGLRLRVYSDLPAGAGFGSSAAVSVAVAAAVAYALGAELQPPQIETISLEVERRQHGAPSGVDTQAVLRGGVLWARRKEDGSIKWQSVSVRSPDLAKFRVYHSGAPAESTGMVVAHVRTLYESDPEGIGAALETIGRDTRRLRRLIESPESHLEELMALVRRCEASLERLGVVPQAARRVIRAIEQEGGAAKISGAGSVSGSGAGCVLVLHPEPEKLEAKGIVEGWEAMDIRLGAPGLSLGKVAS